MFIKSLLFLILFGLFVYLMISFTLDDDQLAAYIEPIFKHQYNKSANDKHDFDDYEKDDNDDDAKSNEYLRQSLEKMYEQEKNLESSASLIANARSARDIVYHVVNSYDIGSMLDVPCGSFTWMPVILTNLTQEFNSRNETFYYGGVDIVQESMDMLGEKYADMFDQWTFSYADFTKLASLPGDYELIFSRDILDRLPYELIFDTLASFASTKGVRYLLVGSYAANVSQNRPIQIGDRFELDLTKPPFNLTDYEQIFHEDWQNRTLILYDVPDYLSNFDFESIKNEFFDDYYD